MKPLVLIAGATGYVGGELLKKLLDADFAVRCLARRPEALRTTAIPSLEVVEGDVLDPVSVQAAMVGVSSAYYLVHSMGSTQSFEEQDRKGAQNFANAARDAGVQRIIYLGGLGRSSEQLSTHLRSRIDTGTTGVPLMAGNIYTAVALDPNPSSTPPGTAFSLLLTQDQPVPGVTPTAPTGM